MAEAEEGAGAGQGPPVPAATGAAEDADPEAGPDWAGLPADLLAKVAEKHIAQTKAGWVAQLKKGYHGYNGEYIQRLMERKDLGLFMFAMVCKGWRKAQLKVGGPLRTRVASDVIQSGSVALAKWALAEGCPRAKRPGSPYNMATAAAEFGHGELKQWLIQEQDFVIDQQRMDTEYHSAHDKTHNAEKLMKGKTGSMQAAAEAAGGYRALMKLALKKKQK